MSRSDSLNFLHQSVPLHAPRAEQKSNVLQRDLQFQQSMYPNKFEDVGFENSKTLRHMRYNEERTVAIMDRAQKLAAEQALQRGLSVCDPSTLPCLFPSAKSAPAAVHTHDFRLALTKFSARRSDV